MNKLLTMAILSLIACSAHSFAAEEKAEAFSLETMISPSGTKGILSVEVINENNFSSMIGQGISVVDFFATWCNPCKMYAPVFAKVAAEMEGTLNFYKIDLEQAQRISQQMGVKSIPTTIIFKDGVKVATKVGFLNEETLRTFIKDNL
jgi:thioredoxin 1